MLNYLSKTLLHVRFLQHHHPPSLLKPLRFISSNANEHSFTVSYLINTCGLSPKFALSTSKRSQFETLDKPDAVINCFKNHSFSETQISKIIRNYPTLLLSNPEETLLPHFEFFHSKGMSSTDLAKIISGMPVILRRSLENHITPSYNFFNDFIQSDEKVIAAIRRFPNILCYSLKANLVPKFNILRYNGVPDSKIGVILENQPRIFGVSLSRFEKIVEDVKRMCFDPLTLKFVVAIHAMMAMSKITWEKKLNVYKSCGWSENMIFSAFRSFPRLMTYSEDKIMATMDYYVNNMGVELSVIVRRPILIALSLEKRIIPRYLIYQTLLSKRLIKKGPSICVLLESTEKSFLQRFIFSYEDEAPQLLKLYQEQLSVSK